MARTTAFRADNAGSIPAGDKLWLVRGRLVTHGGIREEAICIDGGRIAAIRAKAPKGARTVNVQGTHVAPGFIDLHVWGEPSVVARDAVRAGTTGFLATLGPAPPRGLLREISGRAAATGDGARCVGIHLEGPFVSPARGGALPRRGMRAPTLRELRRLRRAAGERLRMMTIAPELRGAIEAIHWCARERIVASLGHSDADADTARRAVEAGARAVTHVFNGMRPFHHRAPSLVDVALTDPRLTAMVIFDGAHVSAEAFRLLLRAKGAPGIALVTDSIRRQGWDVVARRGAYYTKRGVLAGSRLTMMEAVKSAVQQGGASLVEAVRMAGEVPARLLGLRDRGVIAVGNRADLVVFDRQFRVLLTMVRGRIVYRHG